MISRPQLVGLISVFGLGGIAIVMSIARIIALAISSSTTAVGVWTALECSTGIMVACCPALRVLLRRPTEVSLEHSSIAPASLRSPARLREMDKSPNQMPVSNKEGDFLLVGPNEIIKNVEFEIGSERASQISRPAERKKVMKRLEAWDEPV
jgi:hypothetical protein